MKVRWRNRLLSPLVACGLVLQTAAWPPWGVSAAEANPPEFEVFRTTVTAPSTPSTHTVDVLNPNASWSLEATNAVLNNPQLPRVAILLITLNRKLLIVVLHPGHQVHRVPVSLRASNTLTVRLVGLRGATATVVLRGIDEHPPHITVRAPAAGVFLNVSPVSTQLLLSDDVAGLDPGRFAVRVDGQDRTSVFPTFPNALQVTVEGSLDLPDGSHALEVDIADRAGNTASTPAAFSVDRVPPVIANLSPADGATLDVPRPAISASLSDTLSGVDTDSIYVVLDGTDVTAQAAVTEHSIHLIPAADLADGTHTVELLLADRAGNHASASSTFTVITVPPLSAGFIHGFVFNAATEQPLADATITGRGLSGEVRTGPDGRFQFPTPGSGEALLTIDKPGFTSVQRRAEVFATRDVAVEPAFLTPLDSTITPILAVDGGLATNASGDLQVEFPPGAAPRDLDVRITRLAHERQLPGPIPPDLAHLDAVFFEPRFTTFEQPATFRHRNANNLPLGTRVILTLWNEDTHEWMDAGTGQVTGDGQWVEFPIVRFFCWYCDRLPRALPPQAKSPDRDEVSTTLAETREPKKGCEQQVGSVVCPESGELVIEHALPSLRTLGQTRQLRFLYRSTTASPTVLIGTDYRLDPVGSPVDPGTRVPVTTSTAIQIEGRTVGAHFVGASGPLRQAFLWDARNARGQLLPTGAYAATITLANNYSATYGETGVAIPELSAATTTFIGRAIVHNQRDSLFGAGWGLEGLQRLLEQPDGTVLVIDGGGASTVFRPGPMTDLIVANSLSDDVSVFTGHGDGTFQPQQRFVAGGRPIAVAVGQFNGDAFQDVVVALHLAGEIAILLGRGNTLNPPTFIPVGAGPRALAVADLNGDQRGDLIVCNQFSNDVSVLLGRGDGTFAPQVRVGVGQGPVALATGDWNQDGFIDFVTANKESGDLSVRLGIGDGTFEAEQRLSVGGSPVSMLAGDFNGDGRLDLATAGERTNQVSVLLGGGEGTFQPAIQSPLGQSPSGGIAAGRINSDAFLDLVVTGTNQLLILLGEGNGTFRAPQAVSLETGPSAIVVEDVNRDGNQDLAVSTEIIEGPPTLLGGVSVLLGNGDGTFQPRLRVLAGTKSVAIATIEFNNPVPTPVLTFTALPGDFSRLEHQVDGTWMRWLTDGTALHFDARGFHTRTVDRNGNETRYRYDAQDRLVRVEFPGGAAYELAYNPLNGHLSSVTDSAGRTTPVLINGDGNLRQIANPDGATRQFRYDAEHRLISQTNERDVTTDYVYDDFGRLKEAVLPERSIVDPATGNVSLQREVRRFSPAERQGLINSLPPGLGTPENPAPPIVIPLSAFQDGRGNITQLATDHFGAPTTLIDPLGRTTVMTRDVNGLPTKIVRPNDHSTALSYDSLGNLILIREADITEPFFQRIITQFEYEPSSNRLTKIVDARRDEACPSGCVTTIAYDATGNPIVITDALGNITSFTYDPRGLALTVTDALGNLTPDTPDDYQVRFTYDEAAGNLLSTTDQLGRAARLAYDAAGNVTISTDATGRPTAFAYDAMNRLTAVVDAAGNTTRYRYDAFGNLIDVTDANGHATTLTYDSLNQLATTTNPVSQSTQFLYDLTRNLGRVLDAMGQTTTFSYDPANQLSSKLLKDSRELVQDTVTYAYDSLGNLTLVQDADSRLTFEYDPLGRLTKTTTGDPANPALSQPTTELQYTYDANGNRTSLQGLVGGRGTLDLRSRYDSLNRLTTIFHGPLVGIAHFTYDPLSRLTQLRTDIMRTEATYDAASQLLDLRHTNVSAGTTPAFATYTYDPLGNRTNLTDALGLHAYTYDALNRLTGADHPVGSSLPEETFTYDPVGNRLTSYRSTTHRTDAANRLLEDDQYTYMYDANGTLTEQTDKTDPTKVMRYTYDVENQLTRIDFAGGSMAQYRYDGLGRRLEKAVRGTVTRSVSDQEDLLLIFDGANTLQAGVVHGPGIDQPLLLLPDADRDGALAHGEPTRRLLTDGLGSMTALVGDASGVVEERYQYDSFGQPTILAPDGTPRTCSAFGNPFLFTGREYDCESGLYYYRARYYDPRTGRFLQEDPLGGSLSMPEQLNSYTYAINRPTVFTDPYGHLIIGRGEAEKALLENFDQVDPNGIFNQEERVLITRKFVDEINELEAKVLQNAVKSGDAKRAQEIAENVYERIKRKVIRKGTPQEQALIEKLDKARAEGLCILPGGTHGTTPGP